jgi:hypothetical protein
MTLTVDIAEGEPKRRCGDCQACCKLLPIKSINKKAGERCKHQRFHKGCAVYRKKGFPMDCALWSCRWLVGQGVIDDGIGRPDRVHYVIDIMPDYVTGMDRDGNKQAFEVVQIWVDPRYPDAHRDPALRAWLERIRTAGLVRLNAYDAFAIFPPSCSYDRQWHEVASPMDGEEAHTLAEVARALA